MKKLLGGLGVGALVVASACYTPVYRTQTVYRYGYGGSGVDVVVAEDVCRRAAYAQGWRFVREEYVNITGPFTARIRFLADSSVPFRTWVTCNYDARTNLADVR